MNRRIVAASTTLAILTSAALLAPAERAVADEEWQRSSAAIRDALTAGEFADAKRRLDAAAKRAETFAQNDWRRADTRYIAARVHLAAGEYTAALEAFQQARERYQDLFGPTDATVVRTRSGAGRALAGIGQNDAAKAEFAAALDAANCEPTGLEAALGLAELALDGITQEPAGEILNKVEKQVPDVSPALQSWYGELEIRWFLQQGKRPEAEAALNKAAEGAGDTPRRLARVNYLRALVSLEWSESGRAVTQLSEAAQQMEGAGSREHPDLIRILLALAMAQQQLGRGRDADAALLRAQSISQRVLPKTHPLREELSARQAVAPAVQGNLKSSAAALGRLIETASVPASTTLRAQLAHVQTGLGDASATARTVREAATSAASTPDPLDRARQRLDLAASASEVGQHSLGDDLLGAAQQDLANVDAAHPLHLQLAQARVTGSLRAGDLRAANELSATLLDRATATLQPGALLLAAIRVQRVDVLQRSGAFADAVELARTSRDTVSSALPGTAIAAESERLLAEALFAAGQLREAGPAANAALEAARKALPNRHPALARFQLPVARHQLLGGRVREAASASSAAINTVRSAGINGPDAATVYLAAADIELARGRAKAAVGHLDKAEAALSGWPPAAVPETLSADLSASRSRAAIMVGDSGAAISALGEQLPREAGALHTTSLARAAALSATGQLEQAVAALEAGLAALDTAAGGSQYQPALQQAMAMLQARMGRIGDAAATQRLAADTSLQIAGALHPQTVAARRDLAALLRQSADPRAAADALGAARNDATTVYADDDPGTVMLQIESALQLEADGKLTEAAQALTSAQQTLEKTLRAEHPDVASIASMRARMLTEAGSFGEADNLLKRVATNLKRTFGNAHLRVATNALAQARLALARGQPPEATKRVNALRKNFSGVLNTNPEFAAAVTLVAAQSASQQQQWQAVLELTGSTPMHALLRDRALLLGLRAEAEAHSGQLDAAVATSRKALETGESALGLGHPALAPIYIARARILQRAGRGADAANDLQGALDTVRARTETHSGVAALEAELAAHYAYMGRFSEARETAGQSVQTAASILGDEHPRTVAYQLMQAAVAAAAGDVGEAEELYKRARTVQQRVLGYQNPALGGSALALADLYVEAGNTAAAQPLVQRAKALAGNRPSPASARVALAQAKLQIATGNLDTARRSLAQAEKVTAEVWGPGSPMLLESLLARAEVALARRDQAEAAEVLSAAGQLPDVSQDSLGGARVALVQARLALQQGDRETASSLQQRAAAVLEARFGPDHPGLADAVGGYARQLLAVGQTDSGLAELERALSLLSNTLDAGHPRVIALQILQAGALLDAGRLDDADGVLSALPAVDDSTPRARAAALRYVRGLQAQQAGDITTAEALLAQSVADSERLLSVKHPIYAERVVGWGASLIASGKANEAGPRLTRALSVLEGAYGKQSPSVAAALGLLAAVALDSSQDRRAAQLLERQLQILEQSFGNTSRRLSPVLANLGQLRERTGDLEASRTLLQRAVSLTEQHRGLDHIHTATDQSRLASVLVKLGDTKAAEALYASALQVFEATLQPEDPLLLNSLRALAALKLAHGDHVGAADLAARAARG